MPTLQRSLMWRCSCLQHFVLQTHLLLPLPPNWKGNRLCRLLNLIADEEQLLQKLFREVPHKADSNKLAQFKLHSCKLSGSPDFSHFIQPERSNRPPPKMILPHSFHRELSFAPWTWGEDEQLKGTASNQQIISEAFSTTRNHCKGENCCFEFPHRITANLCKRKKKSQLKTKTRDCLFYDLFQCASAALNLWNERPFLLHRA